MKPRPLLILFLFFIFLKTYSQYGKITIQADTSQLFYTTPAFTSDDSQLPTLLKPKFYMNTNLLYWAILLPNIGAEWKSSENTGLYLNLAWTRFHWNHGWLNYGYFVINPGIRYYPDREKKWFAGLELQIGEYSYKMTEKGSQGDFKGGGFTTGYQLKINDKIDVDFKIGFGYLYISHYEKFVRDERGNYRLDFPKSKGYWGPTQVGISLVWKIW